MIVLPVPDGGCPLKVSLELITELENEYGSLYQVSEDILSQSMSVSRMAGFLKMLYRHAGCDVPEEWLLKQSSTDLLVTFLLSVLEPIDKIGAVLLGENQTAPKEEST